MATPSLLFQNPNAPGVAAVPGINSVGALPMPTNSTLVRDPITGIFSSNMDPDGNNQSTVAANGGTVPSGTTADAAAIGNTSGGSGAGAQADPYSIFIGNLTAMLKDAQAKNATAQAGLGGAKDTLTNEAVSNGTPTPFMPGIFSGAQVGNQENVENAFQPAISSINTQMENENTSLSDINSLAGTIASYYKPEAISPGQSLVMPDGTVVQGGHSYTEMINPATGNADGFDQVTGTWASADQTATGNSGSTPQVASNIKSGIVGGIDLSGASVGMQPWASDPNYATEVNTLYTQAQNAAPIPTPTSLDAFIKSMSKSSPITGQMIMSAAATYKIDPNLLAAVIGHESDFGTTGTTTLAINNPAGITGSDGKYTPFNSWTQGVNATAADLAKRIVSPNSGSAAPSLTKADPQGNLYSPAYSARVAQLPTSLQKFVSAGPSGVAFIDGDAAQAAGLAQTASIFGSKAGIPVLTGSDVSAMDDVNNLVQRVQTAQSLISKNLSSGGGSSPIGAFEDWAGGKANNIFQNNPDLTEFNTYIGGVNSAAAQLKTLAGGTGSGLRITGFELGDTISNLPTQGDSYQSANAKLTALNTQISQWMNTNFPDVSSGAIVTPQSQTASGAGSGSAASGGNITMTGPSGTFSVPASQVAAMQQNGYTSQ